MWGDYDGGSNSGGGFIQSQTGTSNNQSGGAKKGSNTSLIPCTISHVLMASPTSGGSDGGGLIVNGVELHTVSVCGIVRHVEVANTNITYVLDDYTAPTIEIKRWIDPNEDDMANLGLNQNDYVRVFGSIRTFKGIRNIVAFKIDRLQDMNEMTLHIIETLHAHLAVQKRQSGQYSLPGGIAGGVSTSHTPMDLGGSNSSVIPDQGLSGIQKQVYEIITAYKNDLGISTNEIKAVLPSVSQNEVRKAIEFLSDEGHIYSTIDEDHFKSTSAEC